MHWSRFAFGYLESVCVCLMCYLIDALLQLTLCYSHIFRSGSDTEVVNVKITINSRSKTPYDIVHFYIKQCHWQNTPLRDSLFLLVEIRKRWSDSELLIREKTLYDIRPSFLQSKAMKIFHYCEFPSGLISLLQIKEDCYQMLFLDIWPVLWRFPIWPPDPLLITVFVSHIESW